MSFQFLSKSIEILKLFSILFSIRTTPTVMQLSSGKTTKQSVAKSRAEGRRGRGGGWFEPPKRQTLQHDTKSV